jgi:hypothetical protein
MANIGVTVAHTSGGTMGRFNHVNLPRDCRVTRKPLPPSTGRGMKRFGTILADVVGRVPGTGYKGSLLLDTDVEAYTRLPFFRRKQRHFRIFEINSRYFSIGEGNRPTSFP